MGYFGVIRCGIALQNRILNSGWSFSQSVCTVTFQTFSGLLSSLLSLEYLPSSTLSELQQ